MSTTTSAATTPSAPSTPPTATEIAKQAAQAAVTEQLAADQIKLEGLETQRPALAEQAQAANAKLRELDAQIGQARRVIAERQKVLKDVGSIKPLKGADACVA